METLGTDMLSVSDGEPGGNPDERHVSRSKVSPSLSSGGCSGGGSTPPAKVLFTLPVYNEADRLETAIAQATEALARAGLDVTLAVAEDGSTDGTKDLLKRLCDRFPRLLVRTESGKLGRGRALRQLWSEISAEVYCFADADLAMGVAPIVDSIQAVLGGAEIVVGSRYAKGAKVRRPPLRDAISQLYNSIVRFGFQDGIMDHQCGLKCFRGDVLRRILPLTTESSWFWDTEILVVARALGVSVTELPVRWEERKAHRTEIRRLSSDIMLHGQGLVRLKQRVETLRTGPPRSSSPADPRPVTR